ncbi:MAG TPA: TraR/DksA C4-type zinc finger protein [Blastocatellia bacterium]|nr:TraR/DksA C4-type zinc finger protein [Blastocatellia bacterium]
MSVEPRRCGRCGSDIPRARVKALPDTVLCVKCSEEIGGDYEITVVAENLAKAGSLKKNYGAWSITKKRRIISSKEE